MDMMKAWQINELGQPQDVLTLVDVPVPVPGAGQVAVRVLAAALNFPDVLMCQGKYQVRPDLPFTPGWRSAARSPLSVRGWCPATASGSARVSSGRRLSPPADSPSSP